MPRKKGDKDLKPRTRPAKPGGYKHPEKLRNRKKREYEYYFVSHETKARKTNGKIGKCKMPGCGREFRLEAWQHSLLHWCSECRNLGEYKNYASYEMRASRFERLK